MLTAVLMVIKYSYSIESFILTMFRMPKLPDINQKESTSSFGSSKKEPRTRRQPILFSNPEKQKVYKCLVFLSVNSTPFDNANTHRYLQLFEFQREVLYLLNAEAAKREEEQSRRLCQNGGV